MRIQQWRHLLSASLLFSLCFIVSALAQTPLKATSYSVTSKTFTAKCKAGAQAEFDVPGQLSFTITVANLDATLTGTLEYLMPEDIRQKIATVSGTPLSRVSHRVTREKITARFEPDTAPPMLHLLIAPLEMEFAGAKVSFEKIVFDIPARPNSITKYSSEEVEALLTVWAIQIRDNKPYRGIVARFNRVITGE